MSRKRVELSDEILYGLCDQVLRGNKAQDIADWVKARGVSKFSREQVYFWFSKGLDRGYLVLCPPLEKDLGARLRG